MALANGDTRLPARAGPQTAAERADTNAERLEVLGDDVTHAPRPWVTSPPFPGLADRLPAGAAMDDALFPVLWTS